MGKDVDVDDATVLVVNLSQAEAATVLVVDDGRRDSLQTVPRVKASEATSQRLHNGDDDA